MITSQIIALIALGICFVALGIHFVRLVKLGKPTEYSDKTGSVGKGVVYSNTTAMLPQNKESAMHHLPTYGLGIIFHIGTFISLLCFVLFFFPFFNHWIERFWLLNTILPLCLMLSAGCGFALFIKRLISKDLKPLSTLDDYLSNLLTSLFQLFTALMFFCMQNGVAVDIYAIVVAYYAVATLLFLYMPLGKLRHVVYFFAARYHLGFFYGWRNVWPTKTMNNEHHSK
ncbi:MAG: hypothetical protein LBV46_04075 [Bacteroidales bacterium]|jgi:nitrate reductase gamma subunit|nr:hypothetical protein [Bacteroidales bacterium]